jgi:hypothetical protein
LLPQQNQKLPPLPLQLQPLLKKQKKQQQQKQQEED